LNDAVILMTFRWPNARRSRLRNGLGSDQAVPCTFGRTYYDASSADGYRLAMADRSFPLIFASDVSATAGFYQKLGFIRGIQNPPSGEPTFIALRRGSAEIAVVNLRWPADQYGSSVGDRPRFEMFVFVDDVDTTLKQLDDEGVPILRDPVDMVWGERIAYVTDPDGNPVGLAAMIGAS
jgi:lactoylglutathione lyase